jgi:UDP-N-acetylmuramoyl-tripeptide--D-alanyl-D-alanine ligase
MLELGEDAEFFHREMGAHASARGVQLLVAVGPLAARMRDGFGAESHAVPDAASAAELLAGLLRPGDAVLVKGSRGVGLELVAETLGSSQRATLAGGDAEDTVLAPGSRPGRR